MLTFALKTTAKTGGSKDDGSEADIGEYKVDVFDDTIPDFIDAEFSGLQAQVKYKNKSSAIRDAIKDADSILSGDNDCSKFFGKYWQKALIELDALLLKGNIDRDNSLTGIRMRLENSWNVYGDSIQLPDNKIGLEKAYRLFDEGTVNSNGPFFSKFSKAKIGSSRATGFQGYDPTSRESRVTQILHELAHMIYKSNDEGGYETLIPNDKGSGIEGQSEINTDTILANCKAEIDKLNGGKKK